MKILGLQMSVVVPFWEYNGNSCIFMEFSMSGIDGYYQNRIHTYMFISTLLRHI